MPKSWVEEVEEREKAIGEEEAKRNGEEGNGGLK